MVEDQDQALRAKDSVTGMLEDFPEAVGRRAGETALRGLDRTLQVVARLRESARRPLRRSHDVLRHIMRGSAVLPQVMVGDPPEEGAASGDARAGRNPTPAGNRKARCYKALRGIPGRGA